MNHSTNLYRSAVLAIAVAALIGKAALAEDLPKSDSSSDIVLAKVTSPINQEQTSASKYADDSGVTEALESVLADSKIELELRLSDHKLETLTADL
jgi:hypothetical protein